LPGAGPAKDLTAHADGAGHLFVVDASWILYSKTASGYDNLGALPIPANYNEQMTWTVDYGGTVHLSYVDRGQPSLYVTRRTPGSATWTSEVNVTPTYYAGIKEPELVAGRDGSVHLAYYVTFPNGIYGSYDHLYYTRTANGTSWAAGEVLRTTVQDPPVSPLRLSFVARTYDSAQALLVAEAIHLARRCGPGDVHGWPVATLGTLLAKYPMAAFDESGVPAFWIDQAGGGIVLQRK
jgi:hypothetical protein